MPDESNEPQRQQILMVKTLNRATDAVDQAVAALQSYPSSNIALNLDTRTFDATMTACRQLRDVLRAFLNELERVGGQRLNETGDNNTA